MSASEEQQAQIDILRYVFGFTQTTVVKCAIDLGIAELLESREGHPITLDELSTSLNCSPSALYRIMRFLVHLGIFKEVNTKSYGQTPLSRLLIKNGERSMAAFVLLETNPVMLESWQGLSTLVLGNGKGGGEGGPSSAFEAVHGENVWRYVEKNPGHSKLFNDAMACSARLAAQAIIDGYPEVFNGVSSLVDVGGNDGTTLARIVNAFPSIRGINFDVPHVISDALKHSGIENVGGDMFKSIPKADAAFIMSVFHDWGDEECIAILKKIKEAIPVEKGKVIIVEIVLDGESAKGKLKNDVGLMIDMALMAQTVGKERTLEEWANIINTAGFSRYTVKHIQSVQSVIEAFV